MAETVYTCTHVQSHRYTIYKGIHPERCFTQNTAILTIISLINNFHIQADYTFETSLICVMLSHAKGLTFPCGKYICKSFKFIYL